MAIANLKHKEQWKIHALRDHKGTLEIVSYKPLTQQFRDKIRKIWMSTRGNNQFDLSAVPMPKIAA